MSKHTPGPWEAARMIISPLDRDRRCGFVVNGPEPSDDLPTRVADLRAPCGINGFAEAQANARLIAAAPDLLEALKRICSMAGPEEIKGQTAVEQAMNAIRKATAE